jgi:pterin-4a-carbinolamine dehydratase
MASKPPRLFISYRREDTAAAARWLWTAVKQTFGPPAVFMDVEGILGGDTWENRIESEVDAATVVIALIGPHWLDVKDEFNRRRIDRPDDWVRRELIRALECDITVIPVLVSDRPPLPPAALDPPLSNLSKRQVLRLRHESWEMDVTELMKRLEGLRFQRTPGRNIRYPTPRVNLRELRGPELAEVLRTLPGWIEKEEEVVGQPYRASTALYRAYEFASFEDAIGFMAHAAQHSTRLKHHPRWENIWRTVTVWLTTWDIGHRISQLDLELARAFDEVREKFPPPRPRRSAP